MNSLTHSSNLISSLCLFDDLATMIFQSPSIGRKRSLSLSEIAVIALLQSAYGISCMKQLYMLLVSRYAREFHLPSYKSFVLAMNDYAPQLSVLTGIFLAMNGQKSGTVKLVDSTAIPV